MNESVEQLVARMGSSLPGADVTPMPNDSPSAQISLLVARKDGKRVAEFFKSDPLLRMDFLSNLTGVDWPEAVIKQKIKTRRNVEGVEKEVEETVETRRAGFLEVVYHLYSMELKHGPLIFRMRTENRSSGLHLPSLTSVWRGAELQEREVYDLYGVLFDDHPDLRRLLMWETFQDHPMRKDYVEPDDYEYEPTAHDEVLGKSKSHDASTMTPMPRSLQP